jgi:predicted N-acyltransferase
MLIHCNKVPNKKKSELRKKSSNLAFAVYDSVTMINTEHWNSIVSYGSEFLQLPFLHVLEKERPDNMQFNYAIIYNNNLPIAITYFQLVDFSSESFANLLEPENPEFSCIITDYLKKHLNNYLKRSADRINMRLLICGNALISGEHGFTCLPNTNKTEAIDALADIIYRISRAEKLRGKIAAVLMKDFYSSSLEYTKEFEEYKYHDFLVEPNMMVNIQWKTFDEYLNAMSKKYRNRAKSILKKGQEIERVNFSAEDMLANTKQIQNLYNNVHLKAKFRMASLTTSYFVEMKRALKDKFNFVGYYHNHKLVGFKTSFILKDETEAHFIGLDYSINKEIELYQNILYDYVKEAIEHSSTKLLLGRTASEIKSTVGAEALELTCYIRHRNPLSNRIIKPFVDHLKPTQWIPRSPFKEQTSL